LAEHPDLELFTLLAVAVVQTEELQILAVLVAVAVVRKTALLQYQDKVIMVATVLAILVQAVAVAALALLALTELLVQPQQLDKAVLVLHHLSLALLLHAQQVQMVVHQMLM
jgi:hypothetical protein